MYVYAYFQDGNFDIHDSIKKFYHQFGLIYSTSREEKCCGFCTDYTITYKLRLTQKKLYKKTDAIFSIYGKNGINP